MAGLIEKDIRLLLQRKASLILFFLLSVVVGFAKDGTFILGYLPFLTAMILISTISYDELDNGYQFLLTLPISERLYVKEKYIFCMVGTALSWLLATVLYFVAQTSAGKEFVWKTEFPELLVFLGVILAMVSIIIPMQMKFGAERGRIVLLCVIGGIVSVAFFISSCVNMSVVAEKTAFIGNVSDVVILIGGVAATMLCVVISYFISIKIMEKKEF